MPTLIAKYSVFIKASPAAVWEQVYLADKGHVLQSHKHFQLSSPLLWTTVSRDTRVIETPEGTVVTVEANCAGVFAKSVARVYRGQLVRDLEDSIYRLKNRVEERERARRVEAVRKATG